MRLFVTTQRNSVEVPLFKSTVFPRHTAAIVKASNTGIRELRYLNWGFLLPQKSKRDGQPIRPKAVSNARCENIQTSSFWRESFRKRRCLVPATAYCELKGHSPATYLWFGVNSQSNQMAPFAFAGLWSNFSGDQYGGGFHSTFTIVTTPPNDFAIKYHNRMPLILDVEQYDRWLFGTVEESTELLHPFASDRMFHVASGEKLKICPTQDQ